MSIVGVFDDVAKSRSPHLWTNAHRGWIAGAVAVLALAGAVKLARR